MATVMGVGPLNNTSNTRSNSVDSLDNNEVAGVESLRINGDADDVRNWGFPLLDLYKLALQFYKEKEGKAVHFSYQDKLRLIAFTKQANFGKYNADTLPPLGVLDVIGRDRRLAWEALGDLTKEEAMRDFVLLLDQLCPLFTAFVEAHKADLEAKERRKREEEEKRKKEEERLKLEEENKRKEEEDRAKQELQRRQIQDALNQQTYAQFKAYAEQQYPGNPEQQAVLVRQLQDQHYHQYMQQLLQQQSNRPEPEEGVRDVEEGEGDGEQSPLANGVLHHSQPESEEDDDEVNSQGTMSMASMWTRKDVREFKESIRREGGDAVLKVGHGETVTVRVPTHEDGTCMFWEFATDSYDIGFGVYFEWTKSATNQVSVHVSESEDEDDYELDEDDEDMGGIHGDLERGGMTARQMMERPPLSVIVPVYRRDCMDEVYAGSHAYPGQGVYLLKFDNSYSFWRSKTVYYRVYYTRYEENSK